MAGAAVLRLSSLSSLRLYSITSSSPISHLLALPLRKPRFTICHAKFDGSIGEAAERMYRMNFEDDELLEEDEENDEEEETESSIDLLVRFVQSMFTKVSKRARKATRSILPDVISPQLVTFAVDGVLILALLSILKAFLEVVCSLGGAVFVAILLLRVLWSAVSYFQSNGSDFNSAGSSYGRTRPAA
ncbi:protein SHORT HYPOCOTYL IN WHITE LIGHT 1 [Solanum lycopersicum]|uniref:Protein SHORT HYPOCOTYL IN WHITE LIGHT 1 n=1 Tax=Solanum lycopersicum TaxID=4081 RepID=A0A3Q7GMR7_SOLLC|nr:protein SHORT HYPOCOTYL IN WHITE LIGHT 1 isoform X1 [Solanum lycopersicum]